LNRAMRMLADAGAVFVGQGVAYPGVATYPDFEGVPDSQRVEFPICEEMNVGAAVGMSLAGLLPVVCLPRVDFLLRAADALVNHLDRLEEMSRGDFRPKVIIRTRVGAKRPLDAGPQHTGDYSEAFRLMLTTVDVVRLTDPAKILVTYQEALARPGSTLVVENLG
jgi:pyruvate/2-oxoglutarate/acetoin dehydrogenase E1 component